MESDESLREAGFRLACLWLDIFMGEPLSAAGRMDGW